MTNKVVLGVTGFVIVGVGLLVGYNGFVLKSVKSIAQERVAELNSKLPPSVKTEHSEGSGLFESQGTYNVVYTDPTNQKVSTLKLNYTMSHGALYYLLGRLTMHTKAELTGEATSLFGYKPYTFTADSVTKSTGNMATTINFPEAKLVSSGVNTTLSGANYKIQYDHSSEYMTSVLHIDSINIRDQQMTANAKDMNVIYNSYVDPLKGADVAFNISTFDASSPAGPFKASNLAFLTKLTSDADTFSTTTNFKVGSLAVATEKDAGFELQYSLNNLHKPSAMYFVNMAQSPELYASKSEEVIQKEARRKFIDVLQHGVTLSLDKFYIKGSMGVVDLNLKAALDKSASAPEISFATKLGLASNLAVSGDIVPLAQMGMIGMNIISAEALDSKAKDIKLKLEFKNGSLLVNGLVNPDISMKLKTVLEQLDIELHSTLKATSY